MRKEIIFSIFLVLVIVNTFGVVGAEDNSYYCEANEDCNIVLINCPVCFPCSTISIKDPNVIAANTSFQCPSPPENIACIACAGTIDYSPNESAICVNNKCEKISSNGLLISNAGVEYETEILEELNGTSEVRVIVDIHSKNDIIIDNILSDLSTSEFKIIGKLIDSSGFYGNITEQGLSKLINDPHVKNIRLDKIVYTTLNESLNETEQVKKEFETNDTDKTNKEKVEIKKTNLLFISILIIFLIIVYFIFHKIFYKKKR